MSRREVDRMTPSVNRQNRCMNCSFLIPRNLRTHSLEQASTPMINLLQAWITPTQLTSECVLCTECLTLLQDRTNTISEGSLSLPAFGHRRICFSCGNSILRATRTHPVRQDRQERNILIRHTPLHMISRLERVCSACWRSATREVQRRDQHDSNRPGLSEATLPDAGSSGDRNIPEPPPLPQQNYHTPQVRSNPTIRSSVYKRAASTSNHCIFVNCFGTERLLIPSSIKDHTYLLISRDDAVANTLESIVGYCCSCLVGKRTVGCCAHIMTVVWYFSWGRYNDVTAPAPVLDDFFQEYDE